MPTPLCNIAINLKGFALCRRPPYVCGLAFWLARVIVLTPKPAICEFWWGWEAKEGLLPTPVLPLGAGWLGGWLLHLAGILEARGLHF